MKISAIVDFYYLERLWTQVNFINPVNMENTEDTSKLNLKLQIDSSFKELSEKLALCFRDYLVLTSIGESRHSSDNMRSGSVPRDLLNLKNSNRGSAMKQGIKYNPEKALNVLFQVFGGDGKTPNPAGDINRWGSSFGGFAWANICKSATFYNKWPPAVFTDHVIDLEHNSGTVFNKVECFNNMDFHINLSYYDIRAFLDYKRSADILNPEKNKQHYDTRTEKYYYDYPNYVHMISHRTKDLLIKYFKVFENRVPVWLFGKREISECACYCQSCKNAVQNSRINEDWYDYIPVTWGTLEFSDSWVEHSGYHGNYDRNRERENREREYAVCEYCEHRFDRNRLTTITLSGLLHDKNITLCSGCLENYSQCNECYNYVPNDDLLNCEYKDLCEYCYNENTFTCEKCNDTYLITNGVNVNVDSEHVHICDDCYGNTSTCENCGGGTFEENPQGYCKHCYLQSHPLYEVYMDVMTGKQNLLPSTMIKIYLWDIDPLFYNPSNPVTFELKHYEK